MEELDSSYRARCSSETLRSGTKGFFSDFCKTVTNNVGDHWLLRVYSRLTTDEDRINCIFTDSKIKDIVLGTLNRVNYLLRDKDARISKAKRLEGAQFIAAHDKNRALLCFSQAVLRAPVKGKV